VNANRGNGGDDGDEAAALLVNPEITKLQSALEARSSSDSATEDGVRRAAVALIFRAGQSGDPELLFIKRAEYPADPWSGQVAFPGGREEVGDSNLMNTAIRETHEEIGLDLARDGVFIGTLEDLRPQTVRLPDIIVRPFVVLLHREREMLLSDEVASAFWVPLAALKREEAWRETTVLARGIQMERRAFHHEGQVVWGMTERILAQLLALLE
jgi:8-oxo-dGTP pyrophosphatase MutT (NUDIX family)